ncbi:MAG: UvrD-helicase domain-containing protein [Bacillota bacterium]
MKFIADFHIHSHYSIATSRQCDPENLCRWAARKGLALIGTGDFTHPAWRKELREKLAPAEEGLYKLKAEYLPDGPEGAGFAPSQIRFIVSGEISSIYKRYGKTRKVHNLVLLPDLDAADKLASSLAEIGNINADGRPILGLDSRNLLEMCLEKCAESVFIPAHIWTPHFSLFGANSGFETIEECFDDLTSYIFALETGLSSDPSMNWRLSAIDRFRLVSNSDAHSPANLAREANFFDTDFSFHGIRAALSGENPAGFAGTLEFYPEEGKYHYDGHRNCGICWKPSETKSHRGICPVCGGKVTIGVLHRVEELADRPERYRPPHVPGYECLVPLNDIIADALDSAPAAKSVQERYQYLINAFGAELDILRHIPVVDISAKAGRLIGEGVDRARGGRLEIRPGFDGKYGRIQIFSANERADLGGQGSLFKSKKKAVRPGPGEKPGKKKDFFELALEITPPRKTYRKSHSVSVNFPLSLDSLNDAQREAVISRGRPLMVIAGPGTGKTQTLTARIAYLLKEGVAPGAITAVTFTNKASEAMRKRLHDMAPKSAVNCLHIGTFHRICLDMLRGMDEYARINILDERDSLAVLQEALEGQDELKEAGKIQREISLLKSIGILADASMLPAAYRRAYQRYQALLLEYGAFDFDDILLASEKLWEADSQFRKAAGIKFSHLLVDEFQDINTVQYKLIRQWAGYGENLFVIGDPDQAIYGFRGADYRFFGSLAEDYPRIKIIQLRTNYRSRPPILSAANSVIAHNPDTIRAELNGCLSGGHHVTVMEASSDLAEGIAVVKEINRLVGGATMLEAHGQRSRPGPESNAYLSFAEIAVLFRTGQQAGILERCFLREGIPYRVIGQKSFLQEEGVAELLQFFKALVEPENIFHWMQVFRQQYFRISSGTWEKIRKQHSAGRSIPEIAAYISRESAGPEKKSFDRLMDAYTRYHACLDNTAPGVLFARWLEENKAEESPGIRHLLRAAEEYVNIADFLYNFSFGREADWTRKGENCQGPEAVTLMTIHAAKGLEFPAVFVTGVEDGLLPLIRNEGENNMEEERRLFFVATTRARERLYYSFAQKRRRRGAMEMMESSRFLNEIPPRYLDWFRQDRKKRDHAGKQMNLF